MKIAILSRYQNTINRGAENFVKELSSRLSKNHQVEVFVGRDADSLTKVIFGKFDFVIPINGRWQSLKFSLARIIGGYKLLITGHSGIGKDDLWNIVVAKPDIFVTLTDIMTSWAKKNAWGSKVIKIPNGVDLDMFSPIGENIKLGLPKPIILSIGALTSYKHHERVIQAASKLTRASVLIVGEGPEEKNLEKLGKELLKKRFKLISFKYQDMPKVYRSCDLFTLPSWDREAFGLVYLEAMASGLGVVAPNDLSRKEIVGEAGLLVDTENINEYAQSLEKALKINWSKETKDQVKKFSWDQIAAQYEKIMKEEIL
jgi:glycosyltransferase involved in cell wall biosynthesis